MTPVLARAPYDWGAILRLIQTAFAGMEGRIDPPSSMHRMTAETIRQSAAQTEIWVIEDAGPVGCVFLTPKAQSLYLGKLAAHPDQQGKGLGLRLLRKAEERALALGRPALQLETRIELAENHRLFEKFGFKTVEATAHPGYTRPTSLKMRKDLT